MLDPARLQRRKGKCSLTSEQIESRMEAYEEAAGHLEAVLPGFDPEDQEQARFVVKHIRRIADSWYKRN